MTTIAKMQKPDRAPITKATLTEARDRLQNIKEQAELLREEELKIRSFLADKLHPEEEGSKTVTVEGIKLTITRPISRSISREDAERMAQDYGDLSSIALRWKPEVVTSVIREHPELEEYIVTKPGQPQISFK